jgi:hypothetical protein
VKIPLVAAGVGGLIGASVGSTSTHYFAQRRERRKLLREKAEALIATLYQTRNRLTTWYLTVEQQAAHATPALVKRPTIILLDLDQAFALQQLYFPALRGHMRVLEDAVLPLLAWLESQLEQQGRDFEAWREQYRSREASLSDTYDIALQATVDAVVRTAQLFGDLPPTSTRPHRHQ